MSLQKALNDWAKSDKGKRELLKAKNQVTLDAGTSKGIAGYRNELSAEDITYGVISMFSEYIKEAGFDFGDYLDVTGATPITLDGEIVWQVDVDFRWSDISRESWYPEKYPHGAYDIVQLMNNGYVASDYVYKVDIDENGNKTYRRSLKAREGAHFMNRAEYYINAHSAQSGYWVEIHPRFVDGMGT